MSGQRPSGLALIDPQENTRRAFLGADMQLSARNLFLPTLVEQGDATWSAETEIKRRSDAEFQGLQERLPAGIRAKAVKCGIHFG
jgi:hypothetical protein